MGRGRRTRLTPEMVDKIANLIATGNYDVVVCGLAGISPSTFYNWLVRGEKSRSGLYKEFLEKVKKAEAAREAKWVKDIEADQSWTSKAWLLERRYPERWGRPEVRITMKQQLELQGKVAMEHEGRFEIDLAASPEVLRVVQTVIEAAEREVDSGGVP